MILISTDLTFNATICNEESYLFKEILLNSKLGLVLKNLLTQVTSIFEIENTDEDFNSALEGFRISYKKIAKALNSSSGNIIDDSNQLDILYKEISRIGKEIFDIISENDEIGFLNDLFEDQTNLIKKITISSNQFFIPYEFLNRTGNANTEALLGIKYIFKRSYPKFETIIEKQSEIFKLIHISDPNLQFVNDIEIPFLNRLKRFTVKVTDVNNLEIQSKDELIQFLNNSDFQFLHFACHLNHNKDSYFHSYLKYKNIIITFTDLNDFDFVKGKIVFLNCCRSGISNINHSMNFTRKLLKKGAACIISVDMDVPDEFAANFSTIFYTVLFKNKLNLNEALYIASNFFLEKKNNIGGFFYSVYVDTNIYNN